MEISKCKITRMVIYVYAQIFAKFCDRLFRIAAIFVFVKVSLFFYMPWYFRDITRCGVHELANTFCCTSSHIIFIVQ